MGKQATDVLDDLTSIDARLNLINDSSQTPSGLQQKIYKSAQNSRGEYGSITKCVSGS